MLTHCSFEESATATKEQGVPSEDGLILILTQSRLQFSISHTHTHTQVWMSDFDPLPPPQTEESSVKSQYQGQKILKWQI